jgi:hypothetical protein
MNDSVLGRIRDLIQEDVGNRGLRSDPNENLITACPGDFEAACSDLAGTTQPGIAIVTGFYISHAQPPCAETDGPLGAVFLARALVPLGFRVALVTDTFCTEALRAGLEACGLEDSQASVPTLSLPPPDQTDLWNLTSVNIDWGKRMGFQRWFPLTHLVALERVGPSHTPKSLETQPGAISSDVDLFTHEVPAEHHDRCHSMGGHDITAVMAPAHRLFEAPMQQTSAVKTIGIGDGGNEIGMGKIPWRTIRRNVPNGGVIACRVPTHHLVVSGTSNWGAYGLAAGVWHAARRRPPAELFSPERERRILQAMIDRGPLVDGVSGRPTLSVDGLDFDRYAEPLRQLVKMLR